MGVISDAGTLLSCQLLTLQSVIYLEPDCYLIPMATQWPITSLYKPGYASLL